MGRPARQHRIADAISSYCVSASALPQDIGPSGVGPRARGGARRAVELALGPLLLELVLQALRGWPVGLSGGAPGGRIQGCGCLSSALILPGLVVLGAGTFA